MVHGEVPRCFGVLAYDLEGQVKRDRGGFGVVPVRAVQAVVQCEREASRQYLSAEVVVQVPQVFPRVRARGRRLDGLPEHAPDTRNCGCPLRQQVDTNVAGSWSGYSHPHSHN